MFDLLRRKQKSIMGIILAGFCAVLMVSFGLDGYNISRAPSTKAIVIDDEEISLREFQQQQLRVERLYRQRFGDNFETFRSMVNFEQQTIDSLLEERLFRRFADRLGITVSRKQLEAEIQSHPFFAGGFTQGRWRQFLQQLALSERELERITFDGIRRDQITGTLADAAAPATSEMRAAYRFDSRKLSFLAAVFRYSDLENLVAHDPTKVRAFYTEHADLYKRPRGVKFVSTRFDAADFESSVDVTEDDLRVMYQQQEHDLVEPRRFNAQVLHFQTKEKKSALDSLLDTNVRADEPKFTEISGADAIKAIAKDASEKLKAGESFAELSKQLVKNPSAHARVEDLGWKTLEEIPEYLRSSAQNLEAGTPAEAIETEDGLALLYASEIKERRTKSFDEVKNALEDGFRKENAPIYLAAESEDFFEKFANSGKSLKDFAAEQNLTVFESPDFLSAAETPATMNPEIFQRITRMQSGEKQIYPGDNEFVVVEAIEAREEEVKPFEEVEEVATRDFKRSEATKEAKNRAEKLIALIAASTTAEADLRREAAAHGAKLEEKKSVARAEAQGDFLTSPENIDAAFALTSDSPVAPRPLSSQGETAVVVLTKVEERSDEEFAKEQDTFSDTERQAAAERLLQAILAVEKRSATIEVNPEIIAQNQ